MYWTALIEWDFKLENVGQKIITNKHLVCTKFFFSLPPNQQKGSIIFMVTFFELAVVFMIYLLMPIPLGLLG